jgi:hypothetical protein
MIHLAFELCHLTFEILLSASNLLPLPLSDRNTAAPQHQIAAALQHCETVKQWRDSSTS